MLQRTITSNFFTVIITSDALVKESLSVKTVTEQIKRNIKYISSHSHLPKYRIKQKLTKKYLFTVSNTGIIKVL